MLQPHQAERAIATTAALIDRAAYAQGLERKPAIAYDEWNVWYRSMPEDTRQGRTSPSGTRSTTPSRWPPT